eukprot:TRINITY_DN15564_c0_g1_i1.p1 TRINITY_DN15564_c0_g1~~TRINITY_DN15564_c0_g1_i1.p1  ORF type:complete len:262 (+),score=53.73 TRINITY_DN15564_c0_g1_i1:22-786(+)
MSSSSTQKRSKDEGKEDVHSHHGDDNKGHNEDEPSTQQKHTKKPQPNLAGDVDTCESHIALLIVDVINDLNFPDNEYIVKQSAVIAGKIEALSDECRRRKIPIIYCNDNWGKWQSSREEIVKHCLSEESQGKEMSKRLLPKDDDYFVLKPKHSSFFGTTLDVLLTHLNTKTLIITGVAGNICVLFTANDAYMRDFAVVVPSDCIASNTKEDDEIALDLIQKVLKGTVCPHEEIHWDAIITKASSSSHKRKTRAE